MNYPKKLIAAKLNVLGGAEDTAAATIEAADDWLLVNPVESNPKGPERAAGIALAEALDLYNNGATEPVPCDASSEPETIPELD